MSIIVQKFGGSSVADAKRLLRVAGIVTDTYKAGHKVVVVVSAQGDTTDDLIGKAKQLDKNACPREMDALLSAGEQISSSLLAMAIKTLGYSAVSLAGWQIPIYTECNHTGAHITDVKTERLEKELAAGNIVIVAGFQGVDQENDINTLGRGGSDTTAVALAAALSAKLCQIYTDVDGVYTADPRIIKNAKKLEEITYDEMLELSTLGAQVLHNRSVELAKHTGVSMEVLSSFHKIPGTKIKEVTAMEKMYVSGVTRDNKVARVAIVGIKDVPGEAYRLFNLLAQNKISVDVILQSVGREQSKDISFTVNNDHLEATKRIISDYCKEIGTTATFNDDIAKVSIVGAGMSTNPGIAAGMFEALYKADINIQMISTSEIKISVLIDRKDSERAVAAIHDHFNLDK